MTFSRGLRERLCLICFTPVFPRCLIFDFVSRLTFENVFIRYQIISLVSPSEHCRGGIFPVYGRRKLDYNECGHYHLDLFLFKLANVDATSESICSYYGATNPKMHQVGFGPCKQRQLNVQFPHFCCFRVPLLF